MLQEQTKMNILRAKTVPMVKRLNTVLDSCNIIAKNDKYFVARLENYEQNSVTYKLYLINGNKCSCYIEIDINNDRLDIIEFIWPTEIMIKKFVAFAVKDHNKDPENWATIDLEMLNNEDWRKPKNGKSKDTRAL